jgi:hypothetical protein
VDSAPRLSRRLLAEIVRADDASLPFAEVARRVGAAAERLGQPRPSYETVRVTVHRVRRQRLEPSTAQVMVDVATRALPPEALLDHLAGIGVLRRP